jgi:hypothetical protein
LSRLTSPNPPKQATAAKPGIAKDAVNKPKANQSTGKPPKKAEAKREADEANHASNSYECVNAANQQLMASLHTLWMDLVLPCTIDSALPNVQSQANSMMQAVHDKLKVMPQVVNPTELANIMCQLKNKWAPRLPRGVLDLQPDPIAAKVTKLLAGNSPQLHAL